MSLLGTGLIKAVIHIVMAGYIKDTHSSRNISHVIGTFDNKVIDLIKIRKRHFRFNIVYDRDTVYLTDIDY